jgi:GTP cyclohydrolase II
MPPFPQRLKDLGITRPTLLLDRNRSYLTLEGKKIERRQSNDPELNYSLDADKRR